MQKRSTSQTPIKDRNTRNKLFSESRVTAEINLHNSARSLQSIWTFVPDEDCAKMRRRISTAISAKSRRKKN